MAETWRKYGGKIPYIKSMVLYGMPNKHQTITIQKIRHILEMVIAHKFTMNIKNELYTAIMQYCYDKYVERGQQNMVTEKTITLRLDEETHKNIKLQAVLKGVTLKQYIVDLVNADIEKTREKGSK